MKDALLNSLSRLRVRIRFCRFWITVDLALPVIVVVYLFVHWMGH